MVETAALEVFLTKRSDNAAHVLSHEAIFGGWNSAMSKAIVDFGDGPRSLALRGSLACEARTITSDLLAEWELLCALSEQSAAVAPSALFADLTGEELGQPTMILEFLDGSSVQMAVLTSEPEAHDAYADGFAALAARIHRVPLEALPNGLAVPGLWDEYIDKRLQHWRAAEADWLDNEPTMRYVAAWLEAHRPKPLPLTLVHGDFQTSNAMVTSDGTQIAVDWEFAHVGDPREDLGWSHTYESVAPPKLVTERLERFCEVYRGLTGHGEETINPASLGWFSLLNIAPGVQRMLPAGKGIVAGGHTSVTAGMAMVMGVPLREHSFRLISQLEAFA